MYRRVRVEPAKLLPHTAHSDLINRTGFTVIILLIKFIFKNNINKHCSKIAISGDWLTSLGKLREVHGFESQ